MIVHWFDAEEESERIIWKTRKDCQEGREEEEQNGEIVKKSKKEWRIKEKKKNK